MNQAAIAVLELNTQVYPEIANTYDSLGEAYMTNGDKELAIENFEKALSLDPDMDSAKDALKALRSTGEDA
jgi:cytochrome c-type biogenesis protein CcmH/NrfG